MNALLTQLNLPLQLPTTEEGRPGQTPEHGHQNSFLPLLPLTLLSSNLKHLLSIIPTPILKVTLPLSPPTGLKTWTLMQRKPFGVVPLPNLPKF